MTTPPYVPPPSPPPTPPPQKSSGCLKWGLIGCGIVIVLGAAFIAAITFFVFGALKRSPIYKEALQRAQSDPRVVAALGSPVEGGRMVSGNVHWDTGEGELNIPISGPKGKAKLHVLATVENGRTKYDVMTVQPEGGALIDLNTPP